MDGEGERPPGIKDMTAEAVKAQVVKAVEKETIGVATRTTVAGGQLSEETLGQMRQKIAKVRAQPAEAIKQKAVEEAAQWEEARKVVRSAQAGVGSEKPVQPTVPLTQAPESPPKPPSFR